MTASVKQAVERYMADWGNAGSMKPEELKKSAHTYFNPDIIYHADGVLYTKDLRGIDEVLKATEAEHKAYRILDFKPLVFAFNDGEATAFVLSQYRVKHVGEWLTVPATQKESHGFQVDELKFDKDGLIVEGWVRRQLTSEEREALVGAAAQRPPASFDIKQLQPLDGSSFRSADMLNAINDWVSFWSVKTGQPDFNSLQKLASADLLVADSWGLRGPKEHYDNLQGLEDIKRLTEHLTARYGVHTGVVARAASDTHNVSFVHWQAELVGKGEFGSMQVDTTDVLLFSNTGKLHVVYQFRTPPGYDRQQARLALPPQHA